MPEGKIVWYNRTKRYGFLVPLKEIGDLFFHKEDLAEDVDEKFLKNGMNVNFSVKNTDRGPRAQITKLLKRP